MARGGSHSQWLGMQSCAKITGSTGRKSTRWGPQPRPTQMLHQDPYSASLPRSWDCASASLDELHWELSASHRMQLCLPIYIWELPKTSSSISLKPGLLRRAHISSVRLGIYRRQRLCLPAQLSSLHLHSASALRVGVAATLARLPSVLAPQFTAEAACPSWLPPGSCHTVPAVPCCKEARLCPHPAHMDILPPAWHQAMCLCCPVPGPSQTCHCARLHPSLFIPQWGPS